MLNFGGVPPKKPIHPPCDSFFQLILAESSTRFKTSSLVHGTSRSAASLESPRRATAPREVPDLRIDGLEPQKPRRGQSAQANIIGLSGCLR